MHHFHPLTISAIDRETPKAVSITFEVPENLKETYAFKAGQYLTLKMEIDGKEVRRAYSICSSAGSGILKVAVKEVAGGTFSSIANNTLKVGQTLDVFPPEGKFVLEAFTSTSYDMAQEPSSAQRAKAKNTYAAFAAGSGITPILSILKTVLEEAPESKFVLVYGNKSATETIFHRELLELQLQNPDRLFIEFVYSRAEEEGSQFGRIQKSTVNYVLKNKLKGHDFHSFYLCGPEPMIEEVTEVLKENGVTADKIHFELFTATEDGGEVDAPLKGHSNIKVIVDDEEFEFSMSREDVVLDAVLEEDIDAPYSCQGGICSTCIARIQEGTAKMRKNQILTDDEIAEGLVLTCQAHPTSDRLVVNYDEV